MWALSVTKMTWQVLYSTVSTFVLHTRWQRIQTWLSFIWNTIFCLYLFYLLVFVSAAVNYIRELQKTEGHRQLYKDDDIFKDQNNDVWEQLSQKMVCVLCRCTSCLFGRAEISLMVFCWIYTTHNHKCNKKQASASILYCRIRNRKSHIT